eukprot:jgi/Mesvir1/12458/Mv00612-RA.1
MDRTLPFNEAPAAHPDVGTLGRYGPRQLIRSIMALVLMTMPGVCLANSRAWGSELAMVDAVRAFCRCADSQTLYKSPPEQLFKQGLHATDNPAEKLLAGMVTSLGIRSAAQVREFCRQESIRLLPISGGSEGNCTGLFLIDPTSHPLLSALSLTMCRRGWVFWDLRKPRPDSIPGIADCTATAPKLVWTRYSHPYDPEHGLHIAGLTTHLKFILFNEHKQLGDNILNDKGHMLEAIWHHAADRSPECLRSINALIPRTFLLYNEEECRQFFTSELRGQVPVCGQHAMPGAAGRQMCDSAVDAPLSAGQVAVACQEAANETWWLAKITGGSKSKGHGLVIPSLHFQGLDSSPCADASADCPTSAAKKPVPNRLQAYGPRGENCVEIAKKGQPRDIVTEYIRRPLLIEGRKNHIRAYVGLASAAPLTIFFQPAYAKFTQRAYNGSAEHASDAFRHFSNVPNPNSEDADVWWTFDELDWYLSAVAGRVAPGYVNATLVPLFKQVAVFSMRMLHAAMPVKYEGFFQEFSFDFFLDEALRVYFLEINTTTGTKSYDLSFFTSFIKAVLDLRLAREKGTWPSEAPGAAMLPEGMDLGTMELLLYKDWDTGSLEGCA